MGTGSWRPAAAWARRDLRRRWPSLLALGVLSGATAGLAFAALAGAVRTDTALERLRDRTRASDAIVFASQIGVPHPDWGALADHPEVDAVAPWALVFGRLDGDPDANLFTPIDDRWLEDVDAPVVVEGRMYDPASDDEMVIADGAAARFGVGVGDTIEFTPYTVEETGDFADAPARDADLLGPDLTIEIVGIVRTPLEPLFVDDGLTMVSPGILRQHPEVDSYENAFVRLADGPGGMATLEELAATDIGPGTPVLDLHSTARRVTASTDVERTALVLLALVITLAGLVLAGQVVVRSASGIQADARVLAAIGMRRTSVAAAAALAHLPAAALAGATAVLTSWVGSRWLPLGQASRLEPDPGARIDAHVVVPGVVTVVSLLLAATFLTAWLVSGRGVGSTSATRGGIAEWARRRAPASVGIGVTLALHRGRGSRSLPVRSALLGAVVGVLGVAGALTLDAGLRDALAHPERAGVAWDGQVLLGGEGMPELPEVAAAVRGIDPVEDVGVLDLTVVPLDGVGVPVHAIRSAPGGAPTDIALVTLDGRAPDGADEIALGPATADALRVGIGEEVSVGEGGDELTVVGTVLFPSEVHSEFDVGAWVTPDAFDRVTAPEGVESLLVTRFADGAEDEGLGALSAVAEELGSFAQPPEVPPELENLRGVLPLPRLLAALLAVLAIAALLHVLMTTARIRAGDFAVLRALGFTRGSTRRILEVQAASVFAFGLVVGIPLGIAAGRVGWAQVAQRVPLEVAAPLALVATALVVPATLLAAQVTSLEPGRRVARLRTAEVLRSE